MLNIRNPRGEVENENGGMNECQNTGVDDKE